MKNFRYRNVLGPRTGVFIDFDDIKSHLKADKAAARQADAYEPTMPCDLLLYGNVSMVDESQCQPVSDIEVSELPIGQERP